MYTSTRTNVVLVCKYVAKVVETIFQAINALEVEDNRSLKQTLTVMNDEFLKGKLFKINKNPDWKPGNEIWNGKIQREFQNAKLSD